MKKTLLATSVAALTLSGLANATVVYDKDGTTLAVYGRVQSVLYSSHAAVNSNSGDSSLNATGRLGFDMRTQLTDGIAGFAKAEWDVADAEANDNFSARYLWLGADFGKYGQIKAGRFEDAIKYVLNTTDIFEDFGTVGQAGNDDKRDGMFMYTWSNGSFDVNLSYQTSKKQQHVDGAYTIGRAAADGAKEANYETLDIEGAYALSVGYTSPDVLFGPIAVRLGYGYTEFSNHAEGHENNTGFGDFRYDYYNHYAASLSWGDLNRGLYLATLLQSREFELERTIGKYTEGTFDVQGAEFVVGYSFDNGVSLRTGYLAQSIDADFGNKTDVTARTIPVYLNYQINPNFNVWAEARFDVGTDDSNEFIKNFKGISAVDYEQNVYSVGARYTF